MKNPTLPVESIREILLRLPVRSVLRFKCVCKSWLSVICDPQFGTSHYDLAAAPSHRLLLVSNDFYVESIDIDAAFNKDSAVVHFPLPPTSPHHYCANYHDKHDILGSCRGLVLLYYDRSSDLILWNPPLGVYIRFPDFEYDILHQYLYGFGYDASADDYLLILISLPEDEHVVETDVYICSFKTERWKWKGNRIDFPYENLDHKFKAASLFNGALHWLVRSEGKEVPVIIAFDLTQRSLSEIPLLNHLTMEEYEAYSLTVMGGCLGVCCLVHGWARVEIWVMKEYKVQSSWTKTIVIPTYGRPRNFFSPICVAKDGQIFVSNIRGRLEKLNDKGERLDHLNYGGGDLYKANLQFVMYRESLLSLPTPVLLGQTSEHDQQ